VTPLWQTTDWGYLRLHEGAARASRYGEKALTTWAERIREAWPAQADVYVYLNNDVGGAAVRDAAAFAGIIERTPSGKRPQPWGASG
jgi:uncharacterized protein YecE (DUF72 family)